MLARCRRQHHPRQKRLEEPHLCRQPAINRRAHCRMFPFVGGQIAPRGPSNPLSLQAQRIFRLARPRRRAHFGQVALPSPPLATRVPRLSRRGW